MVNSDENENDAGVEEKPSLELPEETATAAVRPRRWEDIYDRYMVAHRQGITLGN